MTTTIPKPTTGFPTHHGTLLSRTIMVPSSSSNNRPSHKKKRPSAPPPPLLGPLEEVFQLLEDLFHSRKSLSLSKGVVRGLYTIYQNLKVVRVHSIVLVQFSTDLKIRLVDLKRQLEGARHNRLESGSRQDVAKLTATPEPSIKKVFPVLEQTEKVLSTLQKFFLKKPRLRLSVPPALWDQLARMPESLVRFPDHLARQLSECKTLLQRIVVSYNQLAEAHRTLGSIPRTIHVEEESNDHESYE